MPKRWSRAEKATFRALQKGEEVNKLRQKELKILSTEVPGAGYRTIPIAENRPFKISGTFLAEIIRKYASEFPIGVKLKGVVIQGEVQIENVQIEKLVSLEHCYFTGPIIARGSKFLWFSLTGSVLKDYFDMRSSVISGGVFLRWGFKSLTCTLLRDTAVTGPIDCTGAVFKFNSKNLITKEFTRHADGESFSLSRASMSALFWAKMAERPIGRVNLRNCRIGSFRDDIQSLKDVERDWPKPGQLRMTGLKYEDRTSTNAKALLKWIELQDKDESHYGSYQTVIKALTESGQELEANQVIVAKQRYITKKDPSALTKLLRKIYIGLSEAGIGTDTIFKYTAAAFVVSLAVVFFADRNGQFIPKNNDVLKDSCFKASAPCTSDWVTYREFRIPRYYPSFNPIGYTIDLFVPGVNYGVAADWRPASDWMTALTVAIRAAGIVFTGLLLVCVSGIARFAR